MSDKTHNPENKERSGTWDFLVIALIGVCAWLVIFGVALFVIGLLYPNWYIVMEASDWIIFAGSSIGGIAALCAIYVSYEQNNKLHRANLIAQEQKERLALMPFINLYVESIDTRCGTLTNTCDRVIIIDGGDMSILVPPLYEFSMPNMNVHNDGYYYRVFQLRNIGGDSAYSVELKINDMDVYSGVALGKGEGISNLMKIHGSHGDSFSDYQAKLTIGFKDITGRKYVQNHTCSLNNNYFKTMPAPNIGMPELEENTNSR